MEKDADAPDWDALKTNIFAIISPYLRSQVSIFTTQPGFTPIIMPAFNFNEIIKDMNNE